jgi:TrmH family RNA methyltransferase
MSDPHRIERFRSARRDPALCVLEGLHALKHACRFGAEVREVATRDRDELERLARLLAEDVAAPILAAARTVPAEEYDRLAPLSHPTGVMAIARRRTWEAAGILAVRERPLVLLDHPVHLGNLGAAVRVAAAVDAGGVLSTGPHDPWSPEAVRAAAGLQFAVPVARIDELPDDPGRTVVAVDADAPPLSDVPLPDDALFAFGSERVGLSERLQERADLRVSLPMREGVSSLNLATSVAAVLYLYAARAAR